MQQWGPSRMNYARSSNVCREHLSLHIMFKRGKNIQSSELSSLNTENILSAYTPLSVCKWLTRGSWLLGPRLVTTGWGCGEELGGGGEEESMGQRSDLMPMRSHCKNGWGWLRVWQNINWMTTQRAQMSKWFTYIFYFRMLIAEALACTFF